MPCAGVTLEKGCPGYGLAHGAREASHTRGVFLGHHLFSSNGTQPRSLAETKQPPYKGGPASCAVQMQNRAAGWKEPHIEPTPAALTVNERLRGDLGLRQASGCAAGLRKAGGPVPVWVWPAFTDAR